MAGTNLTPYSEQRARLERLAEWLDSKFRVPGTDLRFGLDGIVGLIPGVGDLSTFALSLYLILEALGMGARKRIVVCMLWNAGIDATVGAIPIVGDLFDFIHKANTKNIRLLIAEHERLESHPNRRA